jgi:ABC-2 type transport system permease protein
MTTLRRHWLEFCLLFRVQILQERAFLVGTQIITTLFPLLLVFGLGLVGAGQTPEGIAYIITGTTVVSLTTVGVAIVAGNLAWSKENGVYLYYASLPIAKSNLLMALIAAKLLLQVPGVVVALVGGSLIHGFPLQPNPLLLVILPLTALSLCGVGAALGLLAPNPEVANTISNAALFIVMFAAPVLIPIEALPLPLQWFGLLLPPTYAADALRRAVAGVVDARLMLDIAVLLGWTVASLVAVSRGLRWRLA